MHLPRPLPSYRSNTHIESLAMAFKLLAVSALVVSSSAVAASSSAAVSSSTAASSSAASIRPRCNFAAIDRALLMPRGGAGPLPDEDTAKFASAFYLTHALYQKLAPGKSAEAYGLEVDPVTEWTSEANADINLVLGIASTLLFWKTPSTNNRAIGAGLLAGILGNIKNLLNDAPDDLGDLVVKGQWLNLAINGFVAHALLSGASYADTALKAYSLWLIGNGLYCALSPNECTKAWGQEAEPSTAQTVMVRVVGQNCIGLGVFCGSIALGKDPAQALGYAFAAILANVLNNVFGNKSFDEVGMKKGPIYGWIAMMLAFVVTLAVEAPAAATTTTA